MKRLGVWIPDGLHIWWGVRGVHLYWHRSPCQPRIVFDRAVDAALDRLESDVEAGDE